MELIATIEFKSDKFMYEKEISGKKNNTTRILSLEEDEKIRNILKTIKYVKILSNFDFCGKLPQTFLRKLKDITRYRHEGLIIYIFTWWV